MILHINFFVIKTKFCLQGTASEATLVALLAAKSRMIVKVKKELPDISDAELHDKLIVYTSDQVSTSLWIPPFSLHQVRPLIT